MIFLRTLGPLVIKVDGEAAQGVLTRKKLQAFLVYLAFARRHARPKLQVMGTLWPDAEQPSGSLNEAKYLINKEAGSVVAVEGDQIKLDPSTFELDTTRFDQLVRDKKWSEAAAMIEGPFLDGFTVGETSGFEEWLEVERVRWRGTCGEVLIREAERLLKSGSPELAEPVAERARRLLEHSDAAIRIYLTALARLERWDEALEIADLFVRTLGREPEPDTVALIDVIKRERKAAPRSEPKSRRRPPLIGRATQLRQVFEVWDACRVGESAAVLVLGDEGMGKTRFAEEVMDQVRLKGATVALARGAPGDLSHARTGLVTLAEGGLLGAPGIAGAPPAAIAALRAESSLWAEKFPGKGSGEPCSFLQGLTEVVRVAALERPVLLVADDAQWMDGESLETLIGLLRSLKQSRVMVLVTASSDPERPELNHLRARIGADLEGVSVSLEPLTHPDLVAMARWALPTVDEDQLDRIARRMSAESGGYPLVAYVIYAAIADGMMLGEFTQPWPRPKNTFKDKLPVDPADHLVGAINVRIGRLTADARAILRVLAVLDNPCRVKRMARGADLSMPEAEKALDELEAKQWVVADARGYAYVAWTIRDIVRKTHVREGEAQRIQGRMTDT